MKRICLFLLLLCGPAWAQTLDTIGIVTADNSLISDLASNTYWQHRDTAGSVYTAGPNDSLTKLGAWIEDATEIAVQVWDYTTVPATLYFSDTSTVTTSSSLKSWTLSPKKALVQGNKYSMALYTVACNGGGNCIPKNDAGGSDGIAIDTTQPGVTTTYTPDDASAASGVLTVFAEVTQYSAASVGALGIGVTSIGTTAIGK